MKTTRTNKAAIKTLRTMIEMNNKAYDTTTPERRAQIREENERMQVRIGELS